MADDYMIQTDRANHVMSGARIPRFPEVANLM
jgi:hypothetical protein